MDVFKLEEITTQNGSPMQNNKIIFIKFEGRKKKLFFGLYFWHISSSFYSNFDQESSLDLELNSTSNKYPLGILLKDPSTPKNKKYLKTRNLIPHPTSSPNRNLSKHTRIYVKNTNKKVVLLMILIPKFILKKCLRPIRYFKFK